MPVTPLPKPNVLQLLKRHDLLYEDAARAWEEGLPLANGSMGVVIWGDGNPLKLTLDSYALWDLREPRFKDARYSYAHYKELYRAGRIAEIKDIFEFRRKRIVPTRLPGPRMDVRFGGAAKNFEARLSLATATAHGKLSVSSGAVEWDAFVASDEDTLVFRIHPGNHPKARLTFGDHHLTKAARAELKRRRFPPPERGRKAGVSWFYQAIPKNGGFLLGWRRIAEKRNGETILVTLLKGDDQPTLVQQAIGQIEKTAARLTPLRRRHARWWRGFWNKSFLSIPHGRLENLFYAEMYKLGCCSRPGKWPITLQGPWGPDGEMPPWHGDYHLDMNVQQSYWPVYAANHLECGEPLTAWATRLLPRFKEECKKFFNGDGAFAPCALGPNGERIYGYHTTEQWPGNGAWLAWHLWLHYLYGQDEEFLKSQAYPFMREFMKLYADILEKGKDGLYHIPLSNSPEYFEGNPEAWGTDTTCDLALIRALGQALLSCAEKFALAEPEAERWRDILNHLAPYPTLATMTPGLAEKWEATRVQQKMPRDDLRLEATPHSLFVMKDMPYAFSHRHQSHLMAIYPLGLMTVEGSAEERATISESLKAYMRPGQGLWGGHAFTWVSLLASRAGRPLMALRMLEEYVDYFISPNTFHLNGDYRQSGASTFSHHPMTLEAGFGAAAGILEMLLQSWGGKIRVFPAVPREWREAVFCDLRAEGAFLVSALLQGGEVLWVQITSERGLPCKLANPFPYHECAVLQDLGNGHRRKLRGGTLEFATRPNGSYRLYGRRPDRKALCLAPVASKFVNSNHFGTKSYVGHPHSSKQRAQPNFSRGYAW